MRFLFQSLFFCMAACVLPAVALGAATTQKTEAPAPSVALTGFVGLDENSGQTRPGHWAPVTVNLRTQGTPFEGTIIVRAAKEDASKAYVPRLVIPASAGINTTKGFSDLFWIGETDSLVAELWSKNKKIQETHMGISPLPNDRAAILVLTNEANAPKHLANASDPLPTRRRSLIFSQPRFLPRHFLGYDAMDAILMDQVSLSGIHEEQLEALRVWVRAGGRLIVSGGPGWQRIDQSPIADWLPVNLEGSATFDPPTQAAMSPPATAPSGGVFIVKSSLKEDAKGISVHWEDEATGLPLVVQKPEGRGMVTFIAFSLMDRPVAESQWARDLQEYLFSRDLAKTSALPRDSTSVETILQGKSLLPMPSAETIGYWMAGYILFFLPCLFAIAWFWRGPGLAWIVLPLGIIGATVVLLRSGARETGGRRSFVQVSFCDAPASGGMGRKESFVSLYSGPEDEVNVLSWSAESVFRPMNLPGFRGAAPEPFHYRTTIEKTPLLEAFAIPPRSSRSFCITSAQDFAPPIEESFALYSRQAQLIDPQKGEWALSGQKINGKIANPAAVPMHNAAIIGLGRALAIGEVSAGQSVTLELEETSGIPIHAWLAAPFPRGTSREINATVELANHAKSALNLEQLGPFSIALAGWTETNPAYYEAQSRKGLNIVQSSRSPAATWHLVRLDAAAADEIHLEMPDFEVLVWSGDQPFDWQQRDRRVHEGAYEFTATWTLCLRPRLSFFSQRQTLWPIRGAWGSVIDQWGGKMEFFDFASRRWVEGPPREAGRRLISEIRSEDGTPQGETNFVHRRSGEIWLRMTGDTFDLTQSNVELKMNYQMWQ